MKEDCRTIWAKRVERWKDSGLTCKAYCAETGLNQHSLKNWKWRLAKEGDAARSADRKRRKQRTQRMPAPSFVEVTPQVVRPEANALEVVVHKTTLRVPSDLDEGALRTLMDVLKGLR